MLKKFANWWRNGKPSHDRDVFDDGQQVYSEDYKEWKFETTIAKDLNIIANLLSEEFPNEIIDNFWKFRYKNEIEFTTKGVSERVVRRKIKLDSLEMTSDYTESKWWKISFEEYEEVYENKYANYAEQLREISRGVESRIENNFYWYIFCKYEDSIMTVKNTLQEAIDNSGDIDNELLEKVKAIIHRFAKALHVKVKEEEEIENLQKEAVSKSLMNRLSDEIDFIDKYIEAQ